MGREHSSVLGMMKGLRHALAHALHVNTGTVDVWWTPGEPSCLMVGFRCSGCGKLQGIAPALARHEQTERRDA